MSMTEIIYGLIAIELIVIGVAIGKSKFKSFIFNPSSLYSLIWGIGLVSLNFRISSEFYSLSIQANTIFFLAWIFFLIGIISSDLFLRRPLRIENIELPINIIKFKRFYCLLLSIHIFFLFLMLLHIFLSLGIYNYFTNAHLYRLAYFDQTLTESKVYMLFSYSILFYRYIIYPIILISAIYGALYSSIVNYKWIPSYFPILGAMLWSIITFGRFPTVIVVSIYVLSWAITSKKKLKIRRIFQIGLIILICILFITSLRSIRLGEKKIEKSYPYRFIGLEVPYYIIDKFKYLYGGLVSFSETLSETKHKEPYYGENTFKGFLWVLNKIFRNIFGLKEYYFRPKALVELQEELIYIGDRIYINAFRTYLYNLWQDFRYLGIIIFPFIFGFLSSLIYKIFYKTNDFYVLGLYIYLIATLILTSSMIWAWEEFCYLIPIIYLIVKYIYRNKIIRLT